MSACNTCDYYNSDDSTCRRYPPILIHPNPVTTGTVVEHPEVVYNDWCGEYKAAE